MGDWTIVEAGGREQLKTTWGGLLAADKARRRVMCYRVRSSDLFKLADSLAKREASEAKGGGE